MSRSGVITDASNLVELNSYPTHVTLIYHHLLSRLDLVVSSHNLRIRRRHALVLRAALAISTARHTLFLLPRLLLLLLLLLRRRLRATALSAVVHIVLLSRRLVLLLRPGWAVVLHVHIRHAAALAVVRQRLVLVRRLGVFGDDVPGVQQARDVAEDAEEDVDEGVGAADAALDPDWRRGLAWRGNTATWM